MLLLSRKKPRNTFRALLIYIILNPIHSCYVSTNSFSRIHASISPTVPLSFNLHLCMHFTFISSSNFSFISPTILSLSNPHLLCLQSAGIEGVEGTQRSQHTGRIRYIVCGMQYTYTLYDMLQALSAHLTCLSLYYSFCILLNSLTIYTCFFFFHKVFYSFLFYSCLHFPHMTRILFHF